MPLPIGWDPVGAIEAVAPVAVRGGAYRAHLNRRDALNAQSYLYMEGRFNRGGPHVASAERWPALYFSSAAHIASGEYTRHLPDLSHLSRSRVSPLRRAPTPGTVLYRIGRRRDQPCRDGHLDLAIMA